MGHSEFLLTSGTLFIQVLSCKWTDADGDGEVYRATVTDVNEVARTVQVLFIDFGNRFDNFLAPRK